MVRVSLGADPEFGFFVERNTKFVQNLKSNEDLCTDEVLDEIIRHQCHSYGTDGCECVGEIRPRYSINANTLNSNILRCLRGCYNHGGVKEAKGFGFNGGSLSKGLGELGSEPFSIGGHIHFGVPHTEKLMARLMLPSVFMLFLESSPNNIERRDNCGYGTLQDYRDQDHGFEYRVPCSWLTEPRLSLGVLSLYHSVVRASEEHCIPNLYARLVNSLCRDYRWSDLVDKHSNNDKRFWVKFLPDIIDVIKRLPDYRKNSGGYRDNIDYLFSMYSRKCKIGERTDLFKCWGLR